MKRRYSLIRTLAIAMLAAASFSASGESFGPTLDKISERGMVFVGHRAASFPFSFILTGADQPDGFSIDICRHVIKAIEEKLGKKIVAQPVDLTENTRTLMVKTGMADLECGSTTNTIGRSQQVAFSTTIFVSEVKAMVPIELAGKTLKDLANKRVVTTLSTTADRLVKQASMSRNISIRNEVQGSHDLSMKALVNGDADVFVADDSILAGLRARSANPEKYVILDESYSVEPYGLLLPKDDPQFKQLVDDVLIGLMKSGEIAKIYDKWFMNPIPPNNYNLNLPMSPLNKAAYANPNDRPVN